HYRENFNYPSISASVTEFWRRWHMSLSSFFRDYVYIPLGGNRCGALARLRNLALTWLLTGLWHGANWNFLLWGGYYLLFLLLERSVLSRLRAPKPLRHVYLLLVAMVGWLIFRVTDFSALSVALRGLWGGMGNALTDLETLLLLKSNCVFLLCAMVGCTPLLRNVYRRCNDSMDGMPLFQRAWTAAQSLYPVLLLVLSTAALVGDQYNPFLYYRF
ncbi:MAG: MBOAT family O-acyltransferase, partial [bacterium]